MQKKYTFSTPYLENYYYLCKVNQTKRKIVSYGKVRKQDKGQPKT